MSWRSSCMVTDYAIGPSLSNAEVVAALCASNDVTY